MADVLHAVQQQNSMALGDFLVFLARIASVPKCRQKMAATKWTSSLLKMVGYNLDTGEFCFSKACLLYCGFRGSTLCLKKHPRYFRHLKTNHQILIIFGTNISDTTCHQMTIKFSTSRNVCFCTT